MKCIKKIRIESKIRKKYDIPKTPYQRLLESSFISDTVKQNLIKIHNSLNPVKLKKEIAEPQQKLYNLIIKKPLYQTKYKNEVIFK